MDEWRRDAACRTLPLALFFPVATNGKYLQSEIDHALSICEGCPVSDECYAFGRRDKERSGIWGGVLFEPGSRRNRRARQAQRAKVDPPPPSLTELRRQNARPRVQPFNRTVVR